MSEERKPLWPWIVALLIGLPVLYVASFGPACWMADKDYLSDRNVWLVYRPIIWTYWKAPSPMDIAIGRWIQFWRAAEYADDLYEPGPVLFEVDYNVPLMYFDPKP